MNAILRAEGVSKVFSDGGSVSFGKAREVVRAVDDVSFRLRRGTTLAVAGESGSGKSTLARMVLGLLQPTSGTAVFDGADGMTWTAVAHTLAAVSQPRIARFATGYSERAPGRQKFPPNNGAKG